MHIFYFATRKPSSIWIVALEAPIAAVQRAEKEQLLIQNLKPRYNKQQQYFWWQGKSHLASSSSTPSAQSQLRSNSHDS